MCSVRMLILTQYYNSVHTVSGVGEGGGVRTVSGVGLGVGEVEGEGGVVWVEVEV